jgi:hypothetical protein
MSFYEHHHRVMHEQGSRETARRVREARMVSEGSRQEPPSRSWLARLVGPLWRRGGSSVPVATPNGMAETLATATIAVPVFREVLEMTEMVCRLPDGSLGRIGIDWKTEADWTAVCVRAAQGDATA